jgi:pilus assembly protein CpaE
MSDLIFTELKLQSDHLRRSLENVLKGHPEFRVGPSQPSDHPELLILDLHDSNPAETFTLIRNILKAAPHTQILLTASHADTQLVLEALRAGVTEFLPAPFTAEDARQALQRIKERAKQTRPATETTRGHIISVLGAKGGVGASSVTVNLGCSLHHGDGRKSVVLVDLDAYGNDLPLLMDLQPSHGFRKIAEDYVRVDRVFLMNVLSKHPSGIHLLASGFDDGNRTLNSQAVEHTFALLRSVFDYVVVDCGMMVDESVHIALTLSSFILVVSSFHVPVIRSTKRLLDELNKLGLPATKIKVIMNRYSPKADCLLSNVEASLQHPLGALIPENYDLASSAINNGRPLMMLAPKADLTHSYHSLAELLTGDSSRSKSSPVAGYLRLLRGKWSKKPNQALAHP